MTQSSIDVTVVDEYHICWASQALLLWAEAQAEGHGERDEGKTRGKRRKKSGGRSLPEDMARSGAKLSEMVRAAHVMVNGDCLCPVTK